VKVYHLARTYFVDHALDKKRKFKVGD